MRPGRGPASRAAATALSLAALAAFSPAPARGETIVNATMYPVPDSIARSRLSYRISRNDRLRMVGPSGGFEMENPEITPEGIVYARLLASPDPPPDFLASPMPWSKIERLQSRGASAATGAKIGAGVGILAGIVLGIAWSSLAGSTRSGDASSERTVEKAAVGGLAGGLLGAGVGGIIGTGFDRWTTIYEFAP